MPEQEPRGPIGLLQDPVFGPFLISKVASSCGTWIQNVAAAVLMFELTRSAFMVGLVSVLQFLPPLLFSLWAGALTDQFDRRKLLIVGRVISGLAVVLLSVLLLVGGIEGFGGPTMLLVVVFVMGSGLALSNPAMQALIPSLVPRHDLEQALAVNAAAPSIARTVGPAASAGLLLVGGPALAFAIAGLGHLAFATTLLFVHSRAQAKPKERPSVFGGLRYLVSDRRAGLLVLGVAMIGFGADPVVTLTPSLADYLGGGGEIVGLLASAFGVGAVLLTLGLRMVRQFLNLRSVGVLGYWLLGAGLLIASALPTLPMATAGFLVGGAGFMMATVALNTRIQRRVPDELRGRVMALWGIAFFGSRPFAAMVNGSLADLLNVHMALVVAAVITIASSAFGNVSYARGDTPP